MINTIFKIFTAAFDLYSYITVGAEALELSRQDPDTLERSIKNCGTYIDQLVRHVVSRGDLVVLQAIVREYPESFNQADKHNRTPILWAARYGHKDIVEYLISLGSDLNQATHPEVEYLTALGAGLEVTHAEDDKYRKTALQWAVENQHLEIALLLIRYGAIIDKYVLQNQNFLTAFLKASDIAEVVANSPEVMMVPIQQKEDELYLLHKAAQEGHLDFIKSILSKNIDLINQPDKCNRSPLSWASRHGQEHVVEYLILLGANPNQKTCTSGNTPLFYATDNNHSKIVLLLIQAGAIIDERFLKNRNIHDFLGEQSVVEALKNNHELLITTLCAAAFRCDKDTISYLISLGVDTTSEIFVRHTKAELLRALNGRYFTAALTLFKVGAIIDETVLKHKNFYHFLDRTDVARAISNNSELFMTLMNYDESIIHVIARKCKLDTLKLILDNNPDLLNQTNKDNQTFLFLAILCGRKDQVEYLISLGADLKQATQALNAGCDGKIPWKWGMENNHIQIDEMINYAYSLSNKKWEAGLKKADSPHEFFSKSSTSYKKDGLAPSSCEEHLIVKATNL